LDVRAVGYARVMNRRRLVAVVVLLAPVLVAAAGAAAATPPAPGVVASCRHHVESGDKPLAGPDADDIAFGRLAYTGLRVIRTGPGRPAVLTVDGARYLGWKSAALLASGAPITVAVVPRFRDVVRLGVGAAPGYHAVIRYVPCSPRHPAFTYDGTVGRWTGWSGMFVATRRVCARLAVWEGDRVTYRDVPLGAACR
jgi:hypothetical protein